jgi:hypothetical protein
VVEVAANLADLRRQLALDGGVCLSRDDRAQAGDLALCRSRRVCDVGGEGYAGGAGLGRELGELFADGAHLIRDLRFDLSVCCGCEDGGQGSESAAVLIGSAGVGICLGGGGGCGVGGLSSGEGEEGEDGEDFETHLDCGWVACGRVEVCNVLKSLRSERRLCVYGIIWTPRRKEKVCGWKLR